MLLCVVRVCMIWLQAWIQKGVCVEKAWEMVLARRILISISMMGRFIPPSLIERELMSSLG